MTITATPPIIAWPDVSLEVPPGPPRSRRAWPSVLMTIGLAAAAAAGALMIGVAYAHATTSASDHSHYAIFWAGVLIFMLPAAGYICSAAPSRLARVATTAGIALFLYLPKLLRNPMAPLYHDELAHWRQVQDIAAAGHLFVPNSIISIIRGYPGLHLVTLTIQRSTGLSTWGAAITVLLITHVLTLLGVFLLIEGITGRSRAAGIGALLYALNASYMYFHTEFAYESLGIGLFFLTLLAMQRMEAAPSRPERRGWAALAISLAATLVTTHHLSTVFLAVVLVVWAVVATRRAARSDRDEAGSVARLSVLVAVSTVGLAVAWFVLVVPQTFAYLSPYLGNATKELVAMVGGGHAGQRHLFAGSSDPAWERVAALAPPVIMLALAIVSVIVWRRSRHRSIGVAVLGLLGLAYFPSIPFILTAFGAEGARRSWAFSYAGLALLVAPWLASLLENLRWLRPTRRFAACAGLLLLFGVVLVGNVAAGLNEYYRFPGPYVFGSDTRSVTPELLATTDWFLHSLGPHQKVVTDRYTALSLAGYGRQRTAAPSVGFPAYDLWFKNSPPSRRLLRELSSSHYQYLVIDKRTAYQLPVLGIYFVNGEPFAYATSHLPISQASLDKFTNYPWTAKVFESDNYIVYRFQFTSFGVPVAPSQP